MLTFYEFLIYIALILPIIAVLNNVFFNFFPEVAKYVQRPINNVVYFLLCATIFALFILFKREHNVLMMSFENGIDIFFKFNMFNISFAFFFSIFAYFLTFQFQRTFKILHLIRTYSLYNQQLSYILAVSFYIIFSHNLIFTSYLYFILMFCILLFLHNRDLKDLKTKYVQSFIIGSTISFCSTIFACFFIFHTNITIFLSPDFQISPYFLIGFLLISVFSVYALPIYITLTEKIFYEDLLPIFIITFIPFSLINTFLYYKVALFIFNAQLEDVAFLYVAYVSIAFFVLSIFFLIKYIGNQRKFIVLFNISVYLTFLTQLLTIENKKQLLTSFVNFEFLLLFILTSIVMSVCITVLMFKTQIIDINNLIKTKQKHIYFYFFTIFLVICVLFYTFFSLNWKNFHIIYILNFIQILTLLFIFIYYVVINAVVKPTKIKEAAEVNEEDIRNITIAPVVLFAFSLLLFLAKGIFYLLVREYV